MLFWTAVQHERGPRKPKMKSPEMCVSLHSHSQDRPIDLSLSNTNTSAAVKFDVDSFHKFRIRPDHPMVVMGYAGELPPEMMRLHAPSAFTSPPLMTSMMTLQHDVWQEVMARLLFTIISWVKQIPAFLVLSDNDQVSFRPNSNRPRHRNISLHPSTNSTKSFSMYDSIRATFPRLLQFSSLCVSLTDRISSRSLVLDIQLFISK